MYKSISKKRLSKFNRVTADIKNEFTNAFPGLIVIGIVSSLAMIASYLKTALKEETSVRFTKQIDNLDAISENLADFQKFIAEQKKNAIAENSALNELKHEKEALKPLVDSDRKIVQAIFIQQEKRQREKVWYERAFGFFAGILSSLAATVIFYWYSRMKLIKNARK
jgi:hypothetical protein